MAVIYAAAPSKHAKGMKIMKNRGLKKVAVILIFAVLSGLVPPGIPALAASSGDYEYDVNSGGTTCTITGYTGSGGDITIPSTLDGYTVTTIGNQAFFGCTGLTGVTIPDSVITIDDQAFTQCIGLTGVTIPDSVATIGDQAFSACIGLTGVTIPDSVTAIGDQAFVYCIGLSAIEVDPSNTCYASQGGILFNHEKTELMIYPAMKSDLFYTIPDSVTAIGDYAFAQCTELTGITIPDSVTAIGDYAFFGCTGLTGVTIPDSVTAIGDYAFAQCTELTGITIPDSVTAIGDQAFAQCTELTGITIPDSVTAIGDQAFAQCAKLINVYLYGEGENLNIGTGAFFDCHSDLVFYCFGGCEGNYGDLTQYGEISGSLYTISIDESIDNGTITADLKIAMAGDTVNLSIEPNDGYMLESVSLAYNEGDTNYAISGTSFNMPDANVTISALFVDIPLTITTESLPSGIVGNEYNITCSAIGGSGYSWSAAGLPDGLTLLTGGVLSGTPVTDGEYLIELTVTDTNSQTTTKTLTLTIKKHCGNCAYVYESDGDPSYTDGYSDDGILKLTVKKSVSGFTYFGVNISPVTGHSGSEVCVFVHTRNGVQIGIMAFKDDFDSGGSPCAAFNVQAGDVIEVYVVDTLSNNASANPIML